MDKPGIAVVAVHGVGQHDAGETSDMIARQLQCAAPLRFENFSCTPLHIAVDTNELPLPATDPAADSATGAASAILPGALRARGRAAGQDATGRHATDIDFTAITLAEGGKHADSYVTSRLRCDQAGHDGIDVFEMYWSDLSHGGTQGGLTALRQMMQLFLHVASLGRTALGTLLASRGKYGSSPLLSFVYGAAAWGYWLLAVPIALGNLLLFSLGAAFLALLVPDSDAGRIGTTVAVAIAAACAAGVAFQRLMRRKDVAPWLQRSGLPAIWLGWIALAALGSWWDGAPSISPRLAAFALALVLSLLVGTVLVKRYDIGRPGALAAWYVILAGAAAWGMAAPAVMQAQRKAFDTVHWFVYLVEGQFAWLVLAWGALAAVNLCLLASGVYAKYRYRRPVRDVGRAIDTALVAAAVPAPLLLTVVLTLWTGFAHLLATRRFALMDKSVPALFGGGSATVAEHLQKLIDMSASPAALPFLVCMAVALACAVLAFLPSILAELLPPDKATDEARTRGLWRWLDQGFRLLHAAKWMAVAAFFLVLPAGTVGQYLDRIDWDQHGLGVLLGGSALAYLSATRLLSGISLGKLSRAFAGMRVVIDTAIDVDNWLRERPVGQTPRLRVMARYVSLLRHLEEQGYRRIVLVTHSQGTVITLDLLRYLKARNPQFLARLAPIDLLTFGSPLRQLYAARFPGIYAWAREADPAQAGVASWGNGYGSGDYVGRNLWSGTEQTRWQSRVVLPNGCYEFCTGALAHIHYFDSHSPDVAAAIIAAIGAPPTGVPAGVQQAAQRAA